MKTSLRYPFSFLLVLLPLRTVHAQPIEVAVDLTDVPRRIVHTSVVLPAKPGPMILHYPKWIPGTHAPSGPIRDVAGLKMAVDGKPQPWKRDDIDPFSFHLTLPEGAKRLRVTFDLLLQPAGSGLGSTLTSASQKVAVLNWNEVFVYPDSEKAMQLPMRASVKLPAGWKFATALSIGKDREGEVHFAQTHLEELIDSPLLCGEYFKEIPLGKHERPHRFAMAADSEASLAMTKEQIAHLEQLLVESEKMFGSQHFRQYTFLLALSDQTGYFGLEHHESSDNRLPENSVVNASQWKWNSSLFPHEYVHSWNGKFRRPADMIVPDFQKAPKTRLLWVYEGLTNYLGWVLTGRSGLNTVEESLDALALTASQMSLSRGRTWRPLDDTSAAGFTLLYAPSGWSSYRRGLDYYSEGTLLWLEVDVLIRRKSKGKKSLDDFCRLFFGGKDGQPRVNGYSFDQLVDTLNQVVAHDWKAHLTRRVSLPNESPPLEGITSGGWNLAYAEKPSPFFETANAKRLNLAASLGLFLSDGKITDVIPDSAAAKAGLTPGMKLLSVNGRKYTDNLLRDAVKATRTAGSLELITESGEFIKTHTISYRGGARYPFLERGEEPDLLTGILRAAGQ